VKKGGKKTASSKKAKGYSIGDMIM